MNAISTVQTTASSVMLRNIRETGDQQAGDAAAAAYSGGLNDRATYYSRSLINSLSEAATLYDTSLREAAKKEETVSSDIRTASFMAGLKTKLQDMAETDQGSGNLGADMLEALADGSLTVTDAEIGVTITAWDVSDPEERLTRRKPGDTFARESWTSFLRTHLKRGSDATFEQTETGAYIDVANGGNAYFGRVGDHNVYLNWPSAMI